VLKGSSGLWLADPEMLTVASAYLGISAEAPPLSATAKKLYVSPGSPVKLTVDELAVV
jgi:hypothetical protein